MREEGSTSGTRQGRWRLVPRALSIPCRGLRGRAPREGYDGVLNGLNKNAEFPDNDTAEPAKLSPTHNEGVSTHRIFLNYPHDFPPYFANFRSRLASKSRS